MSTMSIRGCPPVDAPLWCLFSDLRQGSARAAPSSRRPCPSPRRTTASTRTSTTTSGPAWLPRRLRIHGDARRRPISDRERRTAAACPRDRRGDSAGAQGRGRAGAREWGGPAARGLLRSAAGLARFEPERQVVGR